MQKLFKIILPLFILIHFTTALAFDSFIVRQINFIGLHGISRETVMTYIPLKVGQSIDSASSAKIIQSLYDTEFFDNVSLGRVGDTLYVNVIERPIIAEVKITGNKAIKKDKLEAVLTSVGIEKGRIFNRSILKTIKTSIQNEYESMGKYNALVDTEIKQLSQNRVALKIVISEGIAAKIAQIKITGNHAFKESALLKQFKLGPPGLFSFFTNNDQYTKQKFDTDLEALANFYFDHGYAKFRIDSTHVTMTPDKKQIYILINISEGHQYRFKDFQLTGDTILPRSQLIRQITIKPNTIFSRSVVMDSQKNINQELGNYGYAFSSIQVIPTIDDNTRMVSLNFVVNPGNKMFVRQIIFTGNSKTEDTVLRQSMRQLEGGAVNLQLIQDSLRNLNMLGYLKDVKQQLIPVPGSKNLVDLNIDVKESWAAQVVLSGGYSTAQRFLIGASLLQKNFLGTGKEFDVDFTNSLYSRTYTVTYNDPYYTPDGVSRGVSVYWQKFDPGRVALSNSYTYNTYGANLNYGIPFNDYDRLNFGVGLQNIKLLVSPNPPTEVSGFINRYGLFYHEALFNVNWLHNGWDRAIFPTSGIEQVVGSSFSLPLTRNSIGYYKLTYELEAYQPILGNPKSFIITIHGGLGYGNGLGKTRDLPFFANFYGGGLDSSIPLPGFETNTLGPRDSQGNPFGGNFGAYSRLGLIFPEFNENLRTMVFIGAGNVYNTDPGGLTFRQLRYSAGFSAQLRVMNIPLVVSLAKPISRYSGDRREPFQFAIGVSI